MLLFLLACFFPLFPMDLPGSSISATAQPLATEPRPAVSLPLRCPSQQHLPDSSSLQRPCRQSSVPTVPCLQQLRRSAPASNKPHPAEKSTPVWLAIWRTWAGFANSQHRDAAFATPDNICAHSSLLPHWAAAQTDANLSAHLHRLPTPPPYLRRMRLSPGQGRRCWVLGEVAACPGAAFLQITARANPCSRHLWGTLARAVASI